MILFSIFNKAISSRKLLLFCGLIVMVFVGKAQRATVTLDRAQILLGEQVMLQLKVENVSDEAQHVDQWFHVPDTGNHIEVIRRGKIDTVSMDGHSTFIQKIVLTSFDSGKWEVPVVVPSIKNINGDVAALPFDPVILNVIPVDVSHLKDFHPQEGIVQVQYTNYTWLFIAGGIIVFLLIVLLIIYWWRHRKRRIVGTKKRVIKGSPLQWVLQQIDLLEKEELIQKGEGKAFFTRLDEICRTYFDERTQGHTLQSTSVEMMHELRKYLIREKDRAALYEFAKMSTKVKFAGHKPDISQGEKAIAIAKETVENIEKQVLELTKENAD